MVDDNALIESAARIQEAAWRENGRSEIIKTLCEYIGSTGGVFMNFDYRRQEFVHISTFGLPPAQQSFLDEVFENPDLSQVHLDYSLSNHFEHTMTDYDLMSEEQIRRHGFYDWLERACQVKYFIGSRLNNRGSHAYLLGMHFTEKQGHADEQQARHTALLRPHLANAFRISALREQMQDAATFADLVSANSPYGLLGLDQRGRCVSVNETGEKIVSRNDGIAIDAQGELLIADSISANQIGLQIRKAIQASMEGDLYPGGECVVPKISRHGTYLVRVTPGLRLRYGYDVGVPVVMITISDPEVRIQENSQKFIERFGLTNRESEVVRHLLNGKSLPHTASLMGISHNTSRVHLRNIFEKTDCCSQSQVISKLGGLL